MTYPVFIICRDRLSCLLGMLDWLESVGNADEVYLMDNASTYPPLLEFYETTRHTVLRERRPGSFRPGGNDGHRVGWSRRYFKHYAAGRRFILTDPDVIPVEGCPPDAIERMAAVLDSDPGFRKCGFSIKIDDLPDPWRERTVAWESQFWQHWDDGLGAWSAAIDTTFALHAPWSAQANGFSGCWRLPEPYTVRHLPWYCDPANLDAEERYYVEHADLKVSNASRDIAEMTR